jgi:hypothetical protein
MHPVAMFGRNFRYQLACLAMTQNQYAHRTVPSKT